MKSSALRSRAYRGNRRRGAAAVEFAVLAPIIFMLFLGIFEVGRGMMATEMLTNAARSGARAGALTGASNSDINTAVNSNLTSAGLSGTTTTILVNGSSVDASTAVSGDTIKVTVSVPVDSITWVPGGAYLSGKTLAATVVMIREGP